MIHHIEGDIFDWFEQDGSRAIIHQANCFHTMGSGIARIIREKYPQAYSVDLMTGKGDRNKLGTFSCAEFPNDKYIINLYSQYTYGRGDMGYGRDTSYDALYNGLMKINEDFSGMDFAVPYGIGCGLGGASWTVVEVILKRVFDINIERKNTLTVVKLSNQPNLV